MERGVGVIIHATLNFEWTQYVRSRLRLYDPSGVLNQMKVSWTKILFLRYFPL